MLEVRFVRGAAGPTSFLTKRDAVRPKSKNSTSIMEHIVRDYLIARWGKEIAEDIKPLDIQRWLKSLNTESKLAWTTIAKMRGVMSRIYKVGMLHERVTKNPVLHVETRCKNELPGYRDHAHPDV